MDISNPQVRKDIALRIREEIDLYAERTYGGGHRDHMGGSEIGGDCARLIWSKFRWLKEEKHPGWKLRLFRRGHLEEARFIEYLRGIGFTVKDVDENGKQFRISDVGSHFGGSLDGVLNFPASWEIPGDFLAEYKTMKTGAPFNDLIKKGVMVAHEKYWAQMCVYGYKRNIEYAVFLTVCKNDDNLHIEFVKLDFGLAQDLIRKAEHLITSQRAPVGISKSATDFRCKFCTFVGICHQGESVEKNCRSCLNASPIADAKWSCSLYGGPIPDDVIKIGCATHVSIV